MDIFKILLKEEGLALKPYKDSLGILTIGIGRNLEHVGISEQEANYLLLNDLAKINRDIQNNLELKNIYESLDINRKMFIVLMIFQLGLKGTLTFKNTLNLIKQHKYEEASKALLVSKWHEQTPARVKRMSKLLATGDLNNYFS